jgi:phytoene dehydrogenase-like protein
MQLLRWLVHELPLLFEIKNLKELILMPYRTRHIGQYGLFSLDRTLKARINDPVIRGILSVQCGDYGQPPSKTIMLLHAGVVRHYEFGGYYPRGGGSAIARALVKTIRQSGGRIEMGARVEKILVEKNGKNRRALGVRMSNGDEYRTKNIISNADPHTTFYGMVGEENLSSQLKKRLAKVTYSLSSLTLFLAVAFDPADFGIDSGNLWYASDADFDKIFNEILSPRLYEKDQFSGLFVSSPSKKDPTSYTGRAHTLEVVTFVGYDVFRQFEDSVTEHRPQAYKDLKEKIKKIFFKTLDNIIPHFATHVVFCALGTPLTNRYYTNTTEGCIYGIEKSYRQIGPMSFRTHTEIEGLKLVGASTLSHGVSGTAVSGLNAARAILGCEWAELLVHKKQDLQVYSAEDRSQRPDWLKKRCREPQRSRLSSCD